MTDGYELDLDGDRLREECGDEGSLLRFTVRGKPVDDGDGHTGGLWEVGEAVQ